MCDALAHLFRPIARLAISRRLRFADVAERLQRTFLHEARAQLRQSAPVSRLAVMTGTQRRGVARRLEAPQEVTASAAQLLASEDGVTRFRAGEFLASRQRNEVGSAAGALRGADRPRGG